MLRLLHEIWNLLFQNFLLKLVSLVFGIMLWSLVAHQRMITSEVTREVQLEFIRSPKDLVRIASNVHAFYINVEGPRRVLKETEFDKLTYTIDLSGAQPGKNTFKIDERQIKGLPKKEIEISSITPSEIVVEFDHRMEKRVAIRPRFHGKPKTGFEVTEVLVEPPSVMLTGAAQELNVMEEVLTEPVNLAGREHSFELAVGLELPAHVTPLHPERIVVHVTIGEKRIEREIEVPVVAKGTPKGMAIALTPPRLHLKVSGPYHTLRHLDPRDLRLFVDLHGILPGRHEVVPILKIMKKEVVLLDETLPRISVLVTEAPVVSPREPARPSPPGTTPPPNPSTDEPPVPPAPSSEKAAQAAVPKGGKGGKG
ncbi:MAG: hypothetical protein D6812_16015, partial [Deltaproteobacteria bacterium]